MIWFLLPHTVSNGLYEEITLPLNVSLNEYLITLPIRITPRIHSSYVPSHPDFFVMAELLQHHKLIRSQSLHIGSRICLEYLKYIENTGGVHVSECSGKYPLIIDDTESLDLTNLKHQQIGGNYLAKINSSTSPDSIQFLYKLCSSYKAVYLCKPEAECTMTSTKYVVATHFLRTTDSNNLTIPYYFRMKLDDMNSVFGQTQLEHLRLDFPKLKSMDWCTKYSIPI